MMFDVSLCGFCSVVNCVLMVTVGEVCVMCGRFVVSLFVLLCGFIVVSCRVFVMLCSLAVMLRCLL